MLNLGDARPAWFDDAVCGGRSKLFFGPAMETSDAKLIRENHARLICDACPVMDACRRWARLHRELGFWGGENDEERTRAGYRPDGADANIVRRARAERVS